MNDYEESVNIIVDGPSNRVGYTHKSDDFIKSYEFLEACLEAYRANGYLNEVEITVKLLDEHRKIRFSSEGFVDSWAEKPSREATPYSSIWGFKTSE